MGHWGRYESAFPNDQITFDDTDTDTDTDTHALALAAIYVWSLSRRKHQYGGYGGYGHV